MSQLAPAPPESDSLSEQERDAAARIQAMYEQNPKWVDFMNFWRPLVFGHFEVNRLSRQEITRSSLYQLGMDLSGRLALAQGICRPRSYCSDLFDLVKQYPSLQAFAAAVGLTDRAVSDLIHHRQDMPVEAFNAMLGKVGYALKIVPVEKS